MTLEDVLISMSIIVLLVCGIAFASLLETILKLSSENRRQRAWIAELLQEIREREL